MAGKTQATDRNCCEIEHDRLMAELETCDQLYKNPSEWHCCARIIARRSGQRVKRCMLRK
jgi:hypothetical protein